MTVSIQLERFVGARPHHLHCTEAAGPSIRWPVSAHAGTAGTNACFIRLTTAAASSCRTHGPVVNRPADAKTTTRRIMAVAIVTRLNINLLNYRSPRFAL